ncbi:hypothetical protein Val02_26120 [Virgisporangium aliadipatigenens]|uniref:Sulfatase-modifying factor enzyme domain-containing protein n=1 Tax=Virgisporangium aliadipatigenens TaxID=741659 RepID=A0A8J3YKT8_9ACTN|nr:hypothetical protein [Virgisporangium aliadipatigenens]GIJ45726.1 hypothetical protein Val02_26120 [Virgisporangium aliadipatigenens]
MNLAGWESADGAAVRAHVAAVAERTGAAPLRVHRRRYGTRLLWNATFALGDAVFALVPGGEVGLGHDPATFTPTRAELGSFRCADDPSAPDPLAGWSLESPTDDPPDPVLPGQLALFPGAAPPSPGPPRDLWAYLKGALTPPRRVVLPTLLVAVEPVRCPPGWTHAGVVRTLAARGMRLPTPDEWEHARAAGARTLFPWGERFPAPGSRGPVFRLPGGGVVDRTDGEALGLRYLGSEADELTADPDEVRGSEGGVAGCGGMPLFYHLLPEASAFRDAAQVARHRAGEGWRKAYRPVLAVG